MVYLSDCKSSTELKYQKVVGGSSPEEGQGMVTLLVPSTVLTSLGEGRNDGAAVKGLKQKGLKHMGRWMKELKHMGVKWVKLGYVCMCVCNTLICTSELKC